MKKAGRDYGLLTTGLRHEAGLAKTPSPKPRPPLPYLAWAIDATERGRDRCGRKLFVHAVQDLCSRYRFAPLVAVESKGAAVAQHLERLFQRHGPPLFLKRDNGSPLNAAEVDAVLAEHGVIPLNSPAYYPRYNGAIERGIREMQDALGTCLVRPARWQPQALLPYVVAVHHALNCKPVTPSASGWPFLSGYASTQKTGYNFNLGRSINAACVPLGAAPRKPGSTARV